MAKADFHKLGFRLAVFIAWPAIAIGLGLSLLIIAICVWPVILFLPLKKEGDKYTIEWTDEWKEHQ